MVFKNLIAWNVFRYRLKLNFFDYIDCCTVFVFIDKFLKLVFETLKWNKNTGDIVWGTSQCCDMENRIYRSSTRFLNIVNVDDLLFTFIKFHQSFLPSYVDDVFTWNFVKNTVAAHHDKIIIVLYFKCRDIRLTDIYFRVPSIFM